MMEQTKYNCLIVDDEPIARKIIINYIAQLPFLHFESECINAISAIETLRNSNTIDIIFLDINMPNLSGFQLLKIVQPKQPVIFTTAYPEFAVESYDWNAADYLLKPFSFERFTKGVYKAIDLIKKESTGVKEMAIEKKQTLFIKSDGKNFPVMLDDILFCEAMKNYTMVVLKGDKKLMPLISLSRMEAMLQDAGGEFLQIHRSFIISRKHISSVGASSVMIAKHEIPIGVQFRERFLVAIGMKVE